MISNARGQVLAYALFNLQERGTLFVGPGDMVYEGQIVGETAREGDMVVNPLKGKKLTNIRTQSKDENVLLTPPIRMSLEQAMEYIGDDELVEVTPKNIRLRKRHLSEGDRKRAERVAARRPGLPPKRAGPRSAMEVQFPRGSARYAIAEESLGHHRDLQPRGLRPAGGGLHPWAEPARLRAHRGG